MINRINQFESVAIFGSVARNEADALSDNDLLVVSEHSAQAKDLKSLRNQGYSPAAYTWRTLESLAKHRSLFLLHLKLESKILKDRDSRLSNLLSSVKPPEDYSTALRNSIDLAALTTNVPDIKLLRLWAADVLAVAVRNYLVTIAVQRGYYIFSYRSLIDFAESLFKLDLDAKAALLSLRTWKANYRKKGTTYTSIAPSINEIQLVQRTISLIGGIKIFGSQIGEAEFAYQLMNNIHTSEPWYHALRRYEGVYRAINPNYFEIDVINKIESQISSPCCYLDNGQILWKVLKEQVKTAYKKSLS